ncbi:MAG: hypothetical protein QOA06_10235, partial [Nitrososphaeraceae archaeon]|nr:hypothetical protein [Nitrososphaeraceae archaeon]
RYYGIFTEQLYKKFGKSCIKSGKEPFGKPFKPVREFDKPTGKSFKVISNVPLLGKIRLILPSD